ncbi:MAG: ZIP family metal transporter [Patescibacteria group bacterium]|jgi:zinc and cadmium transporter|nr:ZIP family metal transporter [Patescibacteria group bacterium]
MTNYLYIFGAVIVVSAISLIGVIFLSLSNKLIKKITMFLVSLSAGTLLGDSFFHLIPESIEKAGHGNNGDMIWVALIIGLLSFFVLEKVIHWRHCHVHACDEHPHHLGKMNLIGDCMHNFFDGIIIAGSFLVSIPLGITTLIAVIAHEIPQEIADFGVLIYSGYSKKKAILLNFLTALTAILGAAFAIILGSNIDSFSTFIIPFTAGGFIYIATADLLPELKKEVGVKKSLYQFLTIIFGIAIMIFLKLIFS